MTDRERDLIALRAIEVTTRSALRYRTDTQGRERVLEQAAILLESLERQVIGHGSDADVLAAIEYVRQGVKEYRVSPTPAPPSLH